MCIETVMGQHAAGVRCMEFCQTMRLGVSGGWDNLVKLWDIRGLMPIGAMDCEDRIYALDVVDNRAVVGTRDRKIFVWDVRNMKAPMQTRDSPLKVKYCIVDVCFAQLFLVSNSLHSLLPVRRSVRCFLDRRPCSC